MVITYSDNNNNNGDAIHSKALGLPLQQAAEMYAPLDLEQTPLRIDESLMDKQADPCEDFVAYSCGRWIEASDQFRRENPTSFSLAQRNAVGLVSGIIALEKSRTWSPSPLARFHTACTRTRADPSTWGARSQLYQQLLSDIDTMPLNAQTLAELLGRMSAMGMDTPLSALPMPDPTNTLYGGWILAVSQAGIIGGSDYSSDLSRLFHHRGAPRALYNDYNSQLEMLWRFDGASSAAVITARVSNALEFMRKLADMYLDDEADGDCWLRSQYDQTSNWATYFQNPECYASDSVLRDVYANLSRTRFDWQRFVEQYNANAWPFIRRVWSPQGLRWVGRALDVHFASERLWRDYLATSARYGALQHYFSSELVASGSGTAYSVGIVSPILRQTSSKHYGNWKHSRYGVVAQQLQSRRKLWVPPLERRQHGITRMSVEGTNGVSFVSETLCTDLTFVHLQSLVETYFLQALGLDDDGTRSRILNVVSGGVSTLRELIKTQPSWTTSTKDFFTRKLDSLLVAVGSPPYRALDSGNFSRESIEAIYSGLSAEPEALVQNMLLARQQRNRQIWTLGATPRGTSSGFDMPLYAVNAFFDPSANSIALLAGILQPPFFSQIIEQPAILYARLLAIVGHELGHSLDPNGRLADWSGSVVPAGYWEDSTRSLDMLAFADTEQCLIRLYDGAVTRGGNRENGAQTIGENLADHIGLRVGYNTMIKQLVDATRPTPPRELQQDFFVAWGQSWCARLTATQELQQIENDPHALFEFRISKPLSDMPEFAQAFQCPDTSVMGTPRQRCTFF